MQPLEYDQLRAVWGGVNEVTLPGAGDDYGRGDDAQTQGKCGPGKYSSGYTRECDIHDTCVQKVGDLASKAVGKTAGTATGHVVCSPLLPAAAVSAAKCALDPLCPK
jgi:hypothetical protein